MMRFPDWPKIAGIYRVRLSATHYYIGRTVNCRERWFRHLASLRAGHHPNPHAQAVYNKTGVFDPEVLVVTSTNLVSLEQAWLDAHYGQPGCVNVSRSAIGVMQGRKHSEESLAKMRGKHPSEETRRRLSFARMGHSVSETTRQKLSVAGRGRKRPDTAALNAARSGWTHSPEAKAKISEARTGRVQSEETRTAISQAHKARGTKAPGFAGRKHTDATRRKLSVVATGRRLSEEGRAKRSQAIKASWVKRKAALEGT